MDKKRRKNRASVSICIPAYNEQHNIDNILRQIFWQKQDSFFIKEIIVASDGSTDHTVEIAKEHEKWGVKVIEGKDNRGQTYRQNELIKQTKSDILVLLNADLMLNHDEVLSRLVAPILRGADLSAQWAKPFKPKTLLEKILNAGFELKYFVYSRHKQGNNIYTCVGHMRALSKRFYTNVTFPNVSEGEDQYLYLACISGGYRYKYTHSKNVFFKLPGNFADYKKYAKRIFQTQQKYSDVFTEELARAERNLPVKLQILGCLYAFLRKPFYVIPYIILHVVMQKWALRQPVNKTHVFEPSASTKAFSDA